LWLSLNWKWYYNIVRNSNGLTVKTHKDKIMQVPHFTFGLEMINCLYETAKSCI